MRAPGWSVDVLVVERMLQERRAAKARDECL
jgi:hypothetical protein